MKNEERNRRRKKGWEEIGKIQEEEEVMEGRWKRKKTEL